MKISKKEMLLLGAMVALVLVGSKVELDAEIEHEQRTTGTIVEVYADDESDDYVPSVQEMIINYSNDFGIDTDLTLAIAKLETGHFTSDGFIYCNNVGGMMIGGELISYETLDAGVAAFVNNIAENYISRGLDTPEKMASKYCPSSPDAWAESVRGLM